MKIKINKTRPIIPVLTLISILILSVSLASAVDTPTLVNRFSGAVTLNDAPAPVETVIDAYIGGDHRGSITVKTAGEYVWLGVEGSSPDEGATITFKVGGFDADQTEKWIEASGLRNLDLTTTGTPVSPSSSGGSSSSGGGGFPPSSGGVVNDTGDANGTDTPSVPDDDATAAATTTTTATDESGAGSEEENGFPWVVLMLVGLGVAAIIVYLMRK
ncbi:MAG: hypothetical protein U9N46_03090 [Euryarchaeota archaeon]|nr:hypothetical protein [Euryarchaeota archaeon]